MIALQQQGLARVEVLRELARAASEVMWTLVRSDARERSVALPLRLSLSRSAVERWLAGSARDRLTMSRPSGC
eukprot:498586-Hanusia_phi.AAC.3